jgi:hypothetical protein
MNCLHFQGTSVIKSNVTYRNTNNTLLISWLAIPRSFEGRRFTRIHSVYFQGKRKSHSSKPINYKFPLYYCIVGHNEAQFWLKGTDVSVETTASIFIDGDEDRLPSNVGSCIPSYMQLHPTFNAM